MPLLHEAPPSHVTPHPPQLFGSIFVSAHLLPHFVVPPKHWSPHVAGPASPPSIAWGGEQNVPFVHGLPQLPQFSESVLRLVHRDPPSIVVHTDSPC